MKDSDAAEYKCFSCLVCIWVGANEVLFGTIRMLLFGNLVFCTADPSKVHCYKNLFFFLYKFELGIVLPTRLPMRIYKFAEKLQQTKYILNKFKELI